MVEEVIKQSNLLCYALNQVAVPCYRVVTLNRPSKVREEGSGRRPISIEKEASSIEACSYES